MAIISFGVVIGVALGLLSLCGYLYATGKPIPIELQNGTALTLGYVLRDLPATFSAFLTPLPRSE